jgi:hypothetical protein
MPNRAFRKTAISQQSYSAVFIDVAASNRVPLAMSSRVAAAWLGIRMRRDIAGLLGARSERPRCRTANQRDELAPL